MDRAQKARELLDNPLLQETLTKLRDNAVNAWAASGMMRSDEREAHFRMVRALDELRAELNRYIADADLARRDLQQQ
jgi:hypothetical protein